MENKKKLILPTLLILGVIFLISVSSGKIPEISINFKDPDPYGALIRVS